jgi:hypothetical protein
MFVSMNSHPNNSNAQAVCVRMRGDVFARTDSLGGGAAALARSASAT